MTGTRTTVGIGPRLLVAQAIVLVVAALVAWIAAAWVGPVLFRDHLHMAGVADEYVEQHAAEAFRSAGALALAAALAVSAFAALGATWYLSRRVRRSVAAVSSAAASISSGSYQTRVAPPELGHDFDTMAQAFNAMAAKLGAVEEVRRRMLADLAHELRTPVAVIEAYLEAYEDGVREFDSEAAALLHEQARRLARFSTDLAALSRAEEDAVGQLELERVSASELVASAAAAAQRAFAEKGVGLGVTRPAAPDMFMGDAERLGQVFANLLDNAVRHTPRGGAVTVVVAPDSDGVVITVTDTGDGVAATDLPHLFERFYRAERARALDSGGTGIGLAIAQAVVADHQGRISAHSEGLGLGTSITVWLPTGPMV